MTTTLTSVNGLPASRNPADINVHVYLIPGTKQHISLRAEIAPLLLSFFAEWNVLVMPIDHVPNDTWGFEFKTITGGGAGAPISNHGSGSAGDVCATRLPHHADRMTPAQKAAARALIKKYRVLTWGGDWSAAYLDQMHTETTNGVTLAQIAAVVRDLKLTLTGVPVPVPVPPIWPALAGYDRQWTGTTWIYRSHVDPSKPPITQPLPIARSGYSRQWNGTAWVYAAVPVVLANETPLWPPLAGYDRQRTGKPAPFDQIYRLHTDPSKTITKPLPEPVPGTSRVWDGHDWQHRPA